MAKKLSGNVFYSTFRWAKAKRKAKSKAKPVENYSETLDDVEVISIIQTSMQQNPDIKFVTDEHSISATKLVKIEFSLVIS